MVLESVALLKMTAFTIHVGLFSGFPFRCVDL